MTFVLPDQLAADASHGEAHAFYAATLARWFEYMDGTVAVTGTLYDRRVLLHSLLVHLEQQGLAKRGDLDWSALVIAHVTDAGTDASALVHALAWLWVGGAEQGRA